MITFLLPFKGLAGAKSRWQLEDKTRQALLWRLLEHNLTTVSQVVGAEATYLVSPDPDVFERFPFVSHWQCLGEGLNQDLEHARRGLASRLSGGSLAVLLPDLPELSCDDVQAMVAAAASAQVTLCPDTPKIGTNGLVLAPDVALPFLFEGASFSRHRARAEELGLSFSVLERPGLAYDADHTSDLTRSLIG